MSQSGTNKAVLSVATLFAFRMLGLFMLLPIFSVYADELQGATHSLMGLGFGIYGLSQAICQIPLGHLSDKIGRKPVIILGLSLFAIGSIVCSQATTIYTLILGRTIQGAGAIGSTLIALIADLTTPEQRTKSMALLGMVIGVSFSVAIVTGPAIARYFGFHGVFYCMLVLALLGIAMTLFVIPSPKKEEYHPEVSASRALFAKVLKNRQLNFLNISIFCQHLIFTAIFYAIPTLLETHLTIQWHFYLPIMVLSFVCAVPLILLGEKKKKFKQTFMVAIALVLVAQAILLEQHTSLAVLGVALFLYFISFNALEACLPSSVTKAVDPNAKGTAMGVYSMCQFLGIFVGGALSGTLFEHFQVMGIFATISIIASIWLILSTFMPRFPQTAAPQPLTEGEFNGSRH
jgi:MFS family permease